MELRMHLNNETPRRVREYLNLHCDLDRIDVMNSYNDNIQPMPIVLPFVNSLWLKALTERMQWSNWVLNRENLLPENGWDVVARKLLDGTFREKDTFMEILGHPLLLRVRKVLAELEVGGLDTMPKPDEHVVLRIKARVPDADLILDTFPNMKSLEFSSGEHYWGYGDIYKLMPFYTADEMLKTPTCHWTYDRPEAIDYLGKHLADGPFLEPQMFIDRFWSGRAARARLAAVRQRPEIARYMKKSDMFSLLGVRGVLKIALDKGWVTRYNHDKVFEALQYDEDRAVLLQWDEAHGMQAQMEKLAETRSKSGAFSTSAMRRDWSVFHSGNGVRLTIRNNVTSDVICIPAEVGGRPVVSVEVSDGFVPGEGDFPYREVRKILVDSNLYPEMFTRGAGRRRRSLNEFFSRFNPEVEIEFYGDGPLKKVPGAILLNDEIIAMVPTDERLELPEGVKVIPEDIFDGNTFRSISLPCSLRKIEAKAFCGSGLLEEADIPCEVGMGAFSCCWKLRKIRVNGDIGCEAFQTCPMLESIELGPGVRKIGPFAFDLAYQRTEDEPKCDLKVFRAHVETSAFRFRRFGTIRMVGCDLSSSSMVVTADNLYLERCSGSITARPTDGNSGVYRGIANRAFVDNNGYADKQEIPA